MLRIAAFIFLSLYSVAYAEFSSDFPYEAKSIDVFGSKMHYVEAGKGDPILLIHGNPAWSYIWRNIIPGISNQGHVVAVDLIGFGKSDKPKLEYRFEDHSRYLDEFIRKMELKNITLVLHDWGSALGFDYARRHEQNVRALVFFEALLLPLPRMDLWPENSRKFFQAIRTPEVGWELAVRQNVFIEKRLQDGIIRKLSEAEMEQYRAPFKTIESRKPLWRFPNELPVEGKPEDVAKIQQDYVTWLQTTPIPKLLLFAKPGSLLPASAVNWARVHLKNTTTVYVGEGIHNLQEDRPAEISSSISFWMDRNLKSVLPPAPGILYAVNGSAIHLNCTGQGKPTVVLESGVGQWSTHWYFVQELLQSEMRVCSYDRPGYGWSYPGSRETNARKAAETLHELLKVADEQEPFLLVGHSYGGYILRLFASLFPADVAALSFIDSAHENQWEQLPETKKLIQTGIASLKQMLSQILTGSAPKIPIDTRFPTSLASALQTFSAGASLYETMLAESENAFQSADQVSSSRMTPEIPVVVLTAGNSFAWFVAPTKENALLLRDLNQRWMILQDSLASLSRKSKHLTSPDATHNLVAERPEEVANAIREARSLVGKDTVYFRKMKEPGVQMVLIDGKYHVWTQKVGSGNTKVLLLHGGPGFTHELLESFAEYLPQEGIEIYFYDQLGCYFSDQPEDRALWTIERYSDEVEQVRRALGLNHFVLYGHSWGGQLALQYAVRHPQALKGLIISNIAWSEEAILNRIDEIERKIAHENPGLSKAALDEIFNTKYYRISTVLKEDSFTRSLRHRNKAVSENVIQDLRKNHWSVWDDLPKITSPVLLMTGKEDYASSPEIVKKMCEQIRNCKAYISETGSHLLFYDEPSSYFDALIDFVSGVDAGERKTQLGVRTGSTLHSAPETRCRLESK